MLAMRPGEAGEVTTHSEVEARKKGEVSRKALAVAAPRASSDSLPKCIVVEMYVASAQEDLDRRGAVRDAAEWMLEPVWRRWPRRRSSRQGGGGGTLAWPGGKKK